MTMKRRRHPRFSRVRASIVGAGVLAGFFAAAGNASAQERFGAKRQLAITAENLFAFSSEKLTYPDPSGDRSESSNRFGFLFGGRGDEVSGRGAMVGGHYFIIPSLSIGGTIGYASTTKTESQRGVSRDDPTQSTFVLLPKVGYALMLNDVVGFWFRGGPGFTRFGTADENEFKATLWTLGLDALLVVTPVQHFGFYVGPQAEFSFSGSYTTTNNNGVSTSRDLRYQSLALGVGMLGYFGL